MAKQNLVRVAGTDVSSKRISTRIEDEYQDKIGKAIIRFRFDVNQLQALSKFQQVIIWEATSGTLEQDSNRKFKGNIAKIERSTGEIVVTAYDELWKAVQTIVNQTYDVNIDTEAGEGSEIFIDLASQAGLTADSTTVVATGTTTTDIVLDKFVCKNAEVYERMQTLTDIYDYQFYYMADVDKVFFEPRGFSSNTNFLFSGGDNNNIQEFAIWKEDSTKIFNRVEIVGAFDEVNTTEEFNGTGAQTTFTLSFEPEIVQVVVDGVEQVGGVLGSSTPLDYTIDKSNMQIVFDSGSIPASGTNNVDVFYSYRQPRDIIRFNESSISELGRTISNRFTFKDIQSVDDAMSRGDKLLDIYSNEFVSTRVKITPQTAEDFGILAGQTIRIIDDRQQIDRNVVIKKTITLFPDNFVELELGDKEVRIASIDFDNSKRLKRLEEEESKTGTIITANKGLKHTDVVKRRDLRVNEQDYDSGSGVSIWGAGSAEGFFDWGSGLWGTDDDAFLAEVEHTNNQADDVYDEDFNDTDYRDATTTATWTGTGSVTFTSGQVALTESIDLNNSTITSATLTATEISGTLLYELSANGGTNFETVTSGIKLFFANTGTDLLCRITENAATTAEISNIKIDIFH